MGGLQERPRPPAINKEALENSARELLGRVKVIVDEGLQRDPVAALYHLTLQYTQAQEILREVNGTILSRAERQRALDQLLEARLEEFFTRRPEGSYFSSDVLAITGRKAFGKRGYKVVEEVASRDGAGKSVRGATRWEFQRRETLADICRGVRMVDPVTAEMNTRVALVRAAKRRTASRSVVPDKENGSHGVTSKRANGGEGNPH